MCTRNRVHKEKEVVSKLHVCTNDIVKKYASYKFEFSTRLLNKFSFNITIKKRHVYIDIG